MKNATESPPDAANNNKINRSRRHSHKLCYSTQIEFGQIGYTFRKNFPAYGDYNGVVIGIVEEDSEKYVQCIYTDGDEEDLGLDCLRKLSKSKMTMDEVLEEANNSKRALGTGETCASVIESKKKKRYVENISSKRRKHIDAKSKHEKKKNLFIPIGETIPIDEAAEASLNQARHSQADNSSSKSNSHDEIDESDDNDELWLEGVATILSSAGRPRPKKKAMCSSKSVSSSIIHSTTNFERVTSSSLSDLPQKNTNSFNSREVTVQKIEKRKCDEPKIKKEKSKKKSVKTLMDLDVGSRHGQKVFYSKDPKRLVGEVILENAHGWIEAVIGMKVVKARVNFFILAPEESVIGDRVDVSLSLANGTPKIPVNRPNNVGKVTKKDRSEFDLNNGPAHELGSPPKSLSRTNLYEHQIHSTKALPKSLSQGSKPQGLDKIIGGDSEVSLNSFFYWRCNKCTVHNSYMAQRCSCCCCRKSGSVVNSALLEIVDAVTNAAKSVDEAIRMIPAAQQSAIPKIVLSTFMEKTSIMSTDSLGAPPVTLETFFYWLCGACTMMNSYKRHKCVTCGRHKTLSCVRSVMLEIAEDAANKSRSVEEAMKCIPEIDRTAVPESVVASFITCSEIIGKPPQQRRCLRSKAPGMDFCVFHNDPHAENASDKYLSLKEQNADAQFSCQYEGERAGSPSTIFPVSENYEKITEHQSNSLSSAFISNINNFVSTKNQLFLNLRNWDALSIEDSIICQENAPFANGMLVRRFFTGYGFHDGRIIQIRRKLFFDDEKGSSRPVLVYRVRYLDGDEEDFMHHEVNSLRQIYDVRNIPSTSPPSSQLPKGNVYECQNGGTVEILDNKTSLGSANPHEGGIVVVRFFKSSASSTIMELDLLQLQLNVVRKVDLTETRHQATSKTYSIPSIYSAVHEWPKGTPKQAEQSGNSIQRWNGKRRDGNDVKNPHAQEWMVSHGLWISNEEKDDPTKDKPCKTKFILDRKQTSVTINHKGSVRKCLGRTCRWDPAQISKYLTWEPFSATICEVCHVDKDDHQILICDQCHLGYHMYCVRPIIVNVPTEKWVCNRCMSQTTQELSFEDVVKELQNSPTSIAKFLSLPFEDPKDFFTIHREGLELFKPSIPSSKRQAKIGNARSRTTMKVGSLYFSCNSNKYDWKIPLPLLSSNLYETALTSMVAAMRHCGMDSYSEDLVYSEKEMEGMNDASLDTIEPMSRRNMDIFKDFKANLKLGAYPPIKVVFEERIGFSVKALAAIPRHTLIAEYVGEVTTLERSGETDSDSLMMLLDTGNPKTSLIIDPTRVGNVARFLSGINNLSNKSKRKANVRTRRFAIDGKCLVALFTAKKIDIDDQLYYDYNAGMQGKDEVEWATQGFYDTRNFF